MREFYNVPCHCPSGDGSLKICPRHMMGFDEETLELLDNAISLSGFYRGFAMNVIRQGFASEKQRNLMAVWHKYRVRILVGGSVYATGSCNVDAGGPSSVNANDWNDYCD